MTPPDRIYWREPATPDDGREAQGYATIHDPSDLPGGETMVYAPEALAASPDAERAREAADEAACSLRDQLERVEQERGRRIEALQDDLEEREAALGRAIALAHALWRDEGYGDGRKSIAMPPTLGSWPDALRWIADGPRETGGWDDDAQDGAPPTPEASGQDGPAAPPPAGQRCALCGVGRDDPCGISRVGSLPGLMEAPPCPRAAAGGGKPVGRRTPDAHRGTPAVERTHPWERHGDYDG